MLQRPAHAPRGAAFNDDFGVTATAEFAAFGDELIAQHAEEKPKVPTILHFGEQDQSIPMSDVEKVKKARTDVPIYVYKAGHGFNCDARGSYNAESAKVALDRTRQFIAQHVG